MSVINRARNITTGTYTTWVSAQPDTDMSDHYGSPDPNDYEDFVHWSTGSGLAASDPASSAFLDLDMQTDPTLVSGVSFVESGVLSGTGYDTTQKAVVFNNGGTNRNAILKINQNVPEEFIAHMTVETDSGSADEFLFAAWLPSEPTTLWTNGGMFVVFDHYFDKAKVATGTPYAAGVALREVSGIEAAEGRPVDIWIVCTKWRIDVIVNHRLVLTGFEHISKTTSPSGGGYDPVSTWMFVGHWSGGVAAVSKLKKLRIWDITDKGLMLPTGEHLIDPRDTPVKLDGFAVDQDPSSLGFVFNYAGTFSGASSNTANRRVILNTTANKGTLSKALERIPTNFMARWRAAAVWPPTGMSLSLGGSFGGGAGTISSEVNVTKGYRIWIEYQSTSTVQLFFDTTALALGTQAYWAWYQQDYLTFVWLKEGNRHRIWIGHNLMIDYTDVSRVLPGTVVEFFGYTGGSDGEHFIKGFELFDVDTASVYAVSPFPHVPILLSP